jgi:hypothetical protein
VENFVFGCTVQHKKLWITAGGKDLTSSKILLMMDNMIVTTLGRKATPAVRSIIVQAVQEVLGDPDFGLELSARAKRRLQQERTRKQKTVPFSEIKASDPRVRTAN